MRASIHTLGGLSAHADQQGLLGWLAHFERSPRRTFVVHGEAETAALFAELVAEKPGGNAQAPARTATFEL